MVVERFSEAKKSWGGDADGTKLREAQEVYWQENIAKYVTRNLGLR